ncbi:hypothetical protein quinque_002976 [Culex quinquefasciatus]
MPALDEIKSSWADEVELDSGSLPPPTEIVESGQKVVTEYEAGKAKPVPAAQPESSSAPIKSGKYVPPSMHDSQKAALGANPRGRDDITAFRISNLSEAMTEADLEELNTGLCKGFAYVHVQSRRDAATAIELLNGHGYEHLILNVESGMVQPAKPQ